MLTSVDVDDGVGELVATDLGVDDGARTVDRTSATDAVTTHRQTAVAHHSRRVIRRQLQTGVTISLSHGHRRTSDTMSASFCESSSATVSKTTTKESLVNVIPYQRQEGQSCVMSHRSLVQYVTNRQTALVAKVFIISNRTNCHGTSYGQTVLQIYVTDMWTPRTIKCD